MNMGQMLMQGLTANNPMVAQIMQMKNSGMTPQQALQQMAQNNPQMRQIMQGGNPQQAAMNMLKEAGLDPQQFMRQANQLFKQGRDTSENLSLFRFTRFLIKNRFPLNIRGARGPDVNTRKGENLIWITISQPVMHSVRTAVTIPETACGAVMAGGPLSSLP